MSRVSFGIFDFDPAKAELRRNGLLVRLQAQPARVLAALLNASGEVVTREQLREAVWKGQTFVDFDRGLNFCIAQVRSALGDSAESPRFVRTLPKKGYQFIAPVRITDGEPVVPLSAPPVTARSRLWLLWWFAPVTLLAQVAWLLLGPAGPTLKVAVARFDNQTGSPGADLLAEQITDSLVTELTAIGASRYGVIGNAAELRVPRAERDPNRISAVLNAGYIVIGQVQPDGERNQVIASLLRMPEQTHIGVRRVSLDNGGNTQIHAARLIAESFNSLLLQEADGHRVSPVTPKR